MPVERLAETAMAMSDETWQRHANPWSVWTRLLSAPVFFVALWSPYWIGWWGAAAIAAIAFWAWLNPRLFPPPAHTDNWGSKVTFGERVWLARKEEPVPARHRIVPHVTMAFSMAGLAAAAWGFWTADIWTAALGWTVAVLGKLWFCDRMVWLYEDASETNSEYASWLR